MNCLLLRVPAIFKLVLTLALLPLKAAGQDFTGIWSGYITIAGNQLPYELVIGETNDKLQAYSLTVFTIEGVENTGIKSMKVRSRKNQLSLEDDALIYNDYTTAGRKLTLYSTLLLETEDTLLLLQGSFHTRSADRSSFKGTIRLQKRENSSETKLTAQLKNMELFAKLGLPLEVKKRQEPAPQPEIVSLKQAKEDPTTSVAQPRQVNRSDMAVIQSSKKEIIPVPVPVLTNARPAIVPVKAAADISNRKTEILRSIFFQADSLVLSLYDNGEVDGDTVSVVLNEKVLIARLGLSSTSKTITYHLTANDGDSIRLIMYAENLGSIPPNTGVLVIQDGNEKHQVRFEGDYKRNSAVILRRKRL